MNKWKNRCHHYQLKKKQMKNDERTTCDLCHQDISLNTLRYSHAKNRKAHKIKEPPKIQEE